MNAVSYPPSLAIHLHVCNFEVELNGEKLNWLCWFDIF